MRKHDIFTCENNLLPSHEKISPLLWLLHNKLHFCPSSLYIRTTKKINEYLSEMVWYFIGTAGNNFCLFTGNVVFQIFFLVGHFTNWTGHNLSTDNTLKKTTQDVVVRCSVIVSDHKMWNWPDIFKIWLDNVWWPTVISSTALAFI